MSQAILHPEDLDQVAEKAELIEQQIRDIENLIEERPQRMIQAMENERSTMPPPDDLDDRKREKDFHEDLSRGEIKNRRRYQSRSAFLFVLLLAATISIIWWISTAIIKAGIFS